MNPRTICALALLSSFSVAQAELTRMEAYMEVETQSIIDVREFDFIDNAYNETRFERVLTPIFGFNSTIAANHDTAVEYNGQSARSTSISTLDTNANGFEFRTTLNSTAERGSGASSYTTNSSSIDMVMTFDTDTVLDIFLRIDYLGTGIGDVSAGLEIEGVQGATTDQILMHLPQSAGFVELAFQGTVLAGDDFWLSGGGVIGLLTREHGDSLASGDLVMTAIVRIVPTPAGVFVLGGLGVAAVRRRR